MNAPISRLGKRLRYWRGALPALVLLIVIGGGLLSILMRVGSSSTLAPSTLTSPATTTTATPSSTASLWTDARAREALAKQLTATPMVERIAALQRAASWLLLQDLGPEVLQGSDGWLFLADGLVVHRHRVADSALRADGVIRIARLLAAKHIALVVMLVPDKSRVESGHLGEIAMPAALDSRVRQWHATLDAAGVTSLDLTSELDETRGDKQNANPNDNPNAQPNADANGKPNQAPFDTFLRTDTHWNELGSRVAAHALAARLEAMGIVFGNRVESTIGASTQVDESGDLLHLAGIDMVPTHLRPKPERVQHSVVDLHNDSDDLFGDQGTPSLVLIGTSFSRRSNFVPFLQLESQALVANFAIDGGDFSGAARRYFSSDSFVGHPPKVVIWEIPERTIDAPIDDAERAWLATLNGLR